MKKLTEVQNQLKVLKTEYNSFGKYKYRTAENIMATAKPVLKENNCSLHITDETIELIGILMIESRAIFKDNETNDVVIVKSQAGIDTQKKGMDLAQCFGSSSSYARKRALEALFLLDDNQDSDKTNKHDVKEQKPKIDQERFLKGIEAIKEGRFKKEQMEQMYELTDIQAQQLNSLNAKNEISKVEAEKCIKIIEDTLGMKNAI